MPLVVIVPAVLLPAGIQPDPYADLSLPGLARIASNAVASTIADGIPEAWCRLLGAQRSGDWPLAALAARGDGLCVEEPDPLSHPYWLFATPVQTTVGHREISVASPRMQIPAGQAARLLSDLAAFFAADALAFARGPSSGEWYVRHEGPVHLDTRPPGAFPGGPLDAFLPVGADAPTWRRWLSEMQMLLHAHPLTAEREAAGEPRIDALWLWGGGPELGAAAHSVAAGDARDLRNARDVRDARDLRGYLDDPRYAAALRGAGGTTAGSETEGVAVLAGGRFAPHAVGSPGPLVSHAAPARGDAESVTVVHLDAMTRSLVDGNLDRWRRALGSLDRDVFAHLARHAIRDSGVRLVLGADRHAIALESRPTGLLGRLIPRRERPTDLKPLLEAWRTARGVVS